MARVYFNVRGEGTAYCIPQDLTEGEEFTIYCVPYEGSELLDVKLWTSDDQSIAITVGPEITLTYQSIYRNICFAKISCFFMQKGAADALRVGSLGEDLADIWWLFSREEWTGT